MPATFFLLECTNTACRMRFPVSIRVTPPAACPLCGSRLAQVETTFESERVDPAYSSPPGIEMRLLLDNLRSAFNVGSILRTADGIGVSHVYLGGMSPTPDHPKVNKTALSAEYALPWSYSPNSVDLAAGLKRAGMRLWALEGGASAQPITTRLPVPPGPPLVLVAGNELAGVDPAILSMCDEIVFLPMQGFKRSLNVAVATGIALYLLRYG